MPCSTRAGVFLEDGGSCWLALSTAAAPTLAWRSRLETRTLLLGTRACPPVSSFCFFSSSPRPPFSSLPRCLLTYALSTCLLRLSRPQSDRPWHGYFRRSLRSCSFSPFAETDRPTIPRRAPAFVRSAPTLLKDDRLFLGCSALARLPTRRSQACGLGHNHFHSSYGLKHYIAHAIFPGGYQIANHTP
jgi:hypothetical protein